MTSFIDDEAKESNREKKKKSSSIYVVLYIYLTLFSTNVQSTFSYFITWHDNFILVQD